MKQKKKRAKKYTPSAKKQAFNSASTRQELAQTWIAGGTCLRDIECATISSEQMVDHILTNKQQWTIMLFVFCENDFEYYAKSKLLPPLETYTSPRDLEIFLESESNKFCNAQNQRQYISSGWFIVPSLDTDPDAIRSQIIDHFQHWGAFNRDYCNINWAIKHGHLKRKLAA